MKIELYLLILSNQYGNVLQHFWHDATCFPKEADVRKLAQDKGWIHTDDKLEWQRANQTSYFTPVAGKHEGQQ